MNKDLLFGWLKVILIALVVMLVGIFMVNQALQYKYRSEFLQKPCDICFKYNPDVREAFESYYKPVVTNGTRTFNVTRLEESFVKG